MSFLASDTEIKTYLKKIYFSENERKSCSLKKKKSLNND
jgi:hypothetical protein